VVEKKISGEGFSPIPELRVDPPVEPSMERMPYSGVIAAMVSPCRQPGVIDPIGTEKLCRHLTEHGCDGVFVASSTGEALFLGEDERRLLTAAARKGLADGRMIYAGVSGLGLKQTILYAGNAAEDGANVAVVMAPFLFKVGQPELLTYFLSVADASPIPVALYHHPKMATPIDVETIARVAEHENVVAIKDTSPDIDRAKAVIDATSGKRFSVLQGNERLLCGSLRHGGAGMVTAVAGFAPEAHAALYRAVRSDRQELAQKYQAYILKLLEILCFAPVSESISAFAYAVKVAVQRRGWLECTDVMMSGYEANADFRKSILDHLAAVEMPLIEPVVDPKPVPHQVVSNVQPRVA
jgi:4-hydroxy-tetrahydrodipicolinate synthase